MNNEQGYFAPRLRTRRHTVQHGTIHGVDALRETHGMVVIGDIGLRKCVDFSYFNNQHWISPLTSLHLEVTQRPPRRDSPSW